MADDNFERGDNALRALQAVGYEDPADTIGIKIPTPDGGEATGPEGYPIADLIADLCHLTQRNGLDVGAIVASGITHYGADVIEQAWKNNEEWDSRLQDASNEDRAREVLRTAGVPADYHTHALQYTGILPPPVRT